ncbi:hypothetical protein EJ08DRAFT_579689 [Tothia fuscella]|uniref:C2H2-type domain-containing protein n=1 Tax=Tothia fuscella TaxID=1048955 RepID=A0A9P4P1J7_9PEZI|nr:hypothetical protein EJ08DRAFT_579689 [Tothia fuscella]
MKSEGVFAAPLFQHMSSTLDRQQPSPALTNSSTAVSSSDLSSNPHLVVTVDDCVEDNQSHVYLSRSMSKRSHGSRNKGFLSPNVEQDSTDDDSEVNEVSVFSPALDTGLNLRSSQNVIPERGGIAPDDRDSLNTNSMPTLEEMEEQRHISEKNADVVDWLTHSEVGSDAEGEPKRNRRKKPKGRPRARSTNDAALAHTKFSVGVSNPKFDDSLIPGPGLYLNEQSEMGEEYDTESEESDSPAAPFSLVEDSYFPQTASSSGIQNRNNGRPSHTEDHDVQGITSNLAIMRFRQRAKEVDNASLTATIGSRRRSESDIASVVNSVGVSKLLLSPVPVKDERKGGRRRGSFLENILPTRNNSNKMKRKNSQQSDAIAQGPSPKEGQNIMGAPKRIGSFGRPKSPRVDTNLSANGGEVRSPGGVAAGAFAHAKQIWRSRSRSELAKSPKGLADLWTQSGGPPMPTLASPLNSRPTPQPLGGRDCEDDSADDETNGVDGIAMDLSVRTDMQIIPTYDGFKYQARQLNPRLTDFLLERVTQEQVKRYKRLIDLKLRHSQMVSTRSCASKTFCFSLNGESKSLPPRPGNKDPGATLVGFQILAPGMTEDNLEVTGESQTVAAQFPSGVPLPPVKFLPAEFECPLCFKVKKFYKPSDWTKHVHEDVQPFTCTFSGCNEPKSFKRKADWVRHENERHRQLESWTCNVGDCTHTCYRKDNFVQHLVREHKAPEPKVRTGRSGGTKSPATPMDSMQSWQTNLGFVDENIDDVWALVDKCHKDDIKHPEDEPCKFCGNICSSWKKLTVHLAKHMEQITMPVLVLVEQKRVAGDNELLLGTNPRQTVPVMPTKPMADLPIFLCDEPADMEMDTPGIAVNGVSNMLHSYPPSMTGFQSIQANYSSPAESYAGSSYPAPSSSSRARAASFNDSLTLSRQGTTFPPAGMPSTSMQFDNQQNYIQNPGFMIARGMNNSYLTPTSGSAQEYRNKFRYQS